MNEERQLQGTRRVMDRAIRRLDLFEYVLFGGAAFVSLLGGAAIAWILQVLVGAPFRIFWVVMSLLLFVVPGAVVLRREAHTETTKDETDGS